MFKRLILTALTVPVFYAVASPAPAGQHPFSSPNSASNDILSSTNPTLLDALTIRRDASIYFDYLRDSSSSIATLLVAPSPSFTTLLVPSNSAIIALSRKPHQGPPVLEGGKITVKGSREEEEEMEKYLESWVMAHVVRGDVDVMESGKEWETMQGRKVRFFDDGIEGGLRVEPGHGRATSEQRVGNGKIIFLDNVIPLDEE